MFFTSEYKNSVFRPQIHVQIVNRIVCLAVPICLRLLRDFTSNTVLTQSLSFPIVDKTTFQAFEFPFSSPLDCLQCLFSLFFTNCLRKCVNLYSFVQFQTSPGAILYYNAACFHFVLTPTVSLRVMFSLCSNLSTKLPVCNVRLYRVFPAQVKPTNC